MATVYLACTKQCLDSEVDTLCLSTGAQDEEIVIRPDPQCAAQVAHDLAASKEKAQTSLQQPGAHGAYIGIHALEDLACSNNSCDNCTQAGLCQHNIGRPACCLSSTYMTIASHEKRRCLRTCPCIPVGAASSPDGGASTKCHVPWEMWIAAPRTGQTALITRCWSPAWLTYNYAAATAEGSGGTAQPATRRAPLQALRPHTPSRAPTSAHGAHQRRQRPHQRA